MYINLTLYSDESAPSHNDGYITIVSEHADYVDTFHLAYEEVRTRFEKISKLPQAEIKEKIITILDSVIHETTLFVHID